MEKPETVKRGKKSRYSWEKLKKEGDFFKLPKATKEEANICRTTARKLETKPWKDENLRVSVQKMVKGGYLVELIDPRNTKD